MGNGNAFPPRFGNYWPSWTLSLDCSPLSLSTWQIPSYFSKTYVSHHADKILNIPFPLQPPSLIHPPFVPLIHSWAISSFKCPYLLKDFQYPGYAAEFSSFLYSPCLPLCKAQKQLPATFLCIGLELNWMNMFHPRIYVCLASLQAYFYPVNHSTGNPWIPTMPSALKTKSQVQNTLTAL